MAACSDRVKETLEGKKVREAEESWVVKFFVAPQTIRQSQQRNQWRKWRRKEATSVEKLNQSFALC